MRPRTFILLVLVLLVGAAFVVFFLLQGNGGNVLTALGVSAPTPTIAPADITAQEEPGLPTATPTPEVNLVEVVVATIRLPVGTRLTAGLLTTEMRPATNVAIRAGYTFSDPEELIGRIVGTEIAEGQEILDAMLAFSPTDITSFGSDLALQLDQGRVAVAFEIDRYSGLAYALRPGDFVDVLMSLSLMDLDEEFQTARPNVLEQVDQQALLDGSAFLFSPTTEGRLELIPGLNLVGVVGPGSNRERIPRRVTQLTVQQAEVIWVGTWRDPREEDRARADEVAAYEATVEAASTAAATGSEGSAPAIPTPIPTPQRYERTPDMIIISLTAQDALVLKWALETGIDLDLALRAQGDSQVFITTSVSLPQALEQGGLTVPEPIQFGLEPIATPGAPTDAVPEAAPSP